MLRGLRKLTWIEIKIFLREPLGAIGTIVIPVLVFMVVGRAMHNRDLRHPGSNLALVSLPILVALLIVISAVLSLVTIIAIYREGGILKRLRATPLRPQTILGAHIIVKLIFTAATMFLMILAGRRYIPPGVHVPLFSFTIAMLISTLCILSIGFVIASIVPTARFAQPVGALILYPMITFSGLFVPLASMPPIFRGLAHAMPMTYAVSLLRGIWISDPWSAHFGDLAALIAFFLLFTAVSAKIFRWE
jgi:ABC-2 type transport system permease protein